MTSIYKRQIMLYQLGLYKGKIDGIWGSLSKNATRSFQLLTNIKVDSIYGKQTDKTLLNYYNSFITKEVTEEDFKNIKYFKRKEFACKDKCGYDRVSKQLLYNLDTLRYYIGYKINVSSGCRCRKRNLSVGGNNSSRHYNNLKATKAVDIYNNKTKSLDYRKNIIDFWIKYMPNARYAYSDGYVNSGGRKTIKSFKNMGTSIHLDVK